jgi:hypothetical protein
MKKTPHLFTFLILISSLSFGQKSIQFNFSSNSDLDNSQNNAILFNFLKNGEIVHSEALDIQLSENTLFEVGQDLNTSFWKDNLPDSFNVTNGDNILSTGKLNSYPISLFSFYSISNTNQSSVIKYNNNSVYSYSETGNYNIGIKSNSEILESDNWELSGSELTIYDQNTLEEGDYIIIKNSNSSPLKIVSSNSSQFVVNTNQFESLNQNEPISYSPVFNIFIKNDNGSNENINGDIDFLILKCPNGYEIDLESLYILANDQTENLLLAIENIDKYSLSPIKNHPKISTGASTSDFFSSDNDFLNSTLFTDFDKALLLSNFDFDQSGLIFNIIGVDNFQETYISIKF